MWFKLAISLVTVVGIATPAFAQCTPSIEPAGLPIQTHWSNATQSFSFGAYDQPAIGPSLYPYSFGPGFLPAYNDYIGDNYSIRSIPYASANPNDITATSVMQGLCNQLWTNAGTPVPFRVIDPTGNILGKLWDAPGVVQIIHGQPFLGPFGDSIATIILPPNWTHSAPAGRFPIIAEGHYDVSENLFLKGQAGLGQNIAKMVARSALNGNTGAIGVLWNGGGAIGTAAVNDNARQQFANMVNLIGTVLGGDPNNIIMVGGSRGATTALMMASNPDHYNYRVTYVYANAPGTKTGTHFSLGSPTIPRLFGSAVGFDNAWVPGWTYPAGGQPSLLGLTSLQATLQMVVGTTDPAWADANFSPISDRFVAGLLAAGTQVVLAMGSHDEFIPFSTQLEYLNKLMAWGVPVEAHIVIGGGHTAANFALPAYLGGIAPADIRTRLWYAIRSYVEPGAPVSFRMAETGPSRIHYYAVSRSSHQPYNLPGLNATTQIPVSVEAPSQIYAGLPLTLMATGEPGTLVSAIGYNGGTPVAPPFSCTIGADRLCQIIAGTSFLGGITLTYQITIQKPGQAPQAMNMTNLSKPVLPGRPGVLSTAILAGPMPTFKRGWEVYSDLTNPLAFGGWGQTTWGVAEY